MPINFNDETRYWDLGKHFTEAEAYQDWEGFADAEQVKKRFDGIWNEYHQIEGYSKNPELLYTMCLHFFYTLADTFSFEESEVKDGEIRLVIEAYTALLGTRYLLKETAT